jgi:hypothetical protein
MRRCSYLTAGIKRGIIEIGEIRIRPLRGISENHPEASLALHKKATNKKRTDLSSPFPDLIARLRCRHPFGVTLKDVLPLQRPIDRIEQLME